MPNDKQNTDKDVDVFAEAEGTTANTIKKIREQKVKAGQEAHAEIMRQMQQNKKKK